MAKTHKHYYENCTIKLICLLLAFQLSGCATILSGTSSSVRIKSGNVENAKVYYNGIYKGEAPETISISKKGVKEGSGVIEIKAEGYEPAQIKVERKLQVGFLLVDIFLIPTIVFPIIDLATGSLYRVHPKRVDWNLEKKQTTAAAVETQK